jgi:hypothetical protein
MGDRMTLKVIGAGEGRTGTMSIKLALETLGFGPCHHMSEVIIHPESAKLWLAAIDGEPDWDTIYAEYSSAVDAPTCIFWRELAAFYPDAKIILSLRDAESWFESGQATILGSQVHRSFDGSPLEDFFRKIVPLNYGLADRTQTQDRDFMIAYFHRHNEAVRNTISKDRLLIYDVRDGWDPLCRFLDVPVPDAPFPHANTREDMKRMLNAKDGKAANINSVQETLRDKLRH